MVAPTTRKTSHHQAWLLVCAVSLVASLAQCADEAVYARPVEANAIDVYAGHVAVPLDSSDRLRAVALYRGSVPECFFGHNRPFRLTASRGPPASRGGAVGPIGWRACGLGLRGSLSRVRHTRSWLTCTGRPLDLAMRKSSAVFHAGSCAAATNAFASSGVRVSSQMSMAGRVPVDGFCGPALRRSVSVDIHTPNVNVRTVKCGKFLRLSGRFDMCRNSPPILRATGAITQRHP